MFKGKKDDFASLEALKKLVEISIENGKKERAKQCMACRWCVEGFCKFYKAWCSNIIFHNNQCREQEE